VAPQTGEHVKSHGNGNGNVNRNGSGLNPE